MAQADQKIEELYDYLAFRRKTRYDEYQQGIVERITTELQTYSNTKIKIKRNQKA